MTLLTGLDDWKRFWDQPGLNSVSQQPVFTAWPPGRSTLTPNWEPPPAAFRLAPGSVGKGAGPNGRDLGADVDALGPGDPYHAWRQTPAYQQWLKDTGQTK